MENELKEGITHSWTADNKSSISHGLQQAMAYASMLDIPFAYSSNGDGFLEYDFMTGTERELGLDEFSADDRILIKSNHGVMLMME